jgi:hypothetical protein
MAHAWYLERSAPERWSLKANLVRDSEGEERNEPELPAAILAHHRKLMLQLVKADAAPENPEG